MELSSLRQRVVLHAAPTRRIAVEELAEPPWGFTHLVQYWHPVRCWKDMKGHHGPFCAVGKVVGEHSREAGMVPGGSGGSLSLTLRPCQQGFPCLRALITPCRERVREARRALRRERRVEEQAG